MNLSYVERYFADFLSALESDEAMDKPGTNEKIVLPDNLFVIGTVNVDETTYMFSPKVLDRANVIEFKTIPVSRYMVAFQLLGLEKVLIKKKFENLFEDVKIYFLS